MLPHLADEFGDGIPLLFAPSFVELFDVIGGLGCVGLSGSRAGDVSLFRVQMLEIAWKATARRRQSGRGRGG